MRKPNLVLLPGFMCNERLFERQIKTLAKLGIHCQVPTWSNESTIFGIAAEILRDTSAPIALAGLSMGGIIALEIFRQAPERVTHLALLNTTPFADRSQEERRRHINRIHHGELLAVLSEDLKPKYLAPANANSEILSLISAMATRLGPEVFVRQSFALMFRQDYLKLLPDIKCRTLILTGDQDRVCGQDISTYMASKMPQAEHKIIKDCGHLSTLEKAEEVTQSLLDLLQINTNVKKKAKARGNS